MPIKNLEQVPDIHYSTLPHPYFTLMCNWTTISIIPVDEVDGTNRGVLARDFPSVIPGLEM